MEKNNKRVQKSLNFGSEDIKHSSTKHQNDLEQMSANKKLKLDNSQELNTAAEDIFNILNDTSGTEQILNNVKVEEIKDNNANVQTATTENIDTSEYDLHLIRVIVKEYLPLDYLDGMEFRRLINISDKNSKKEKLSKHITKLYESTLKNIKRELMTKSVGSSLTVETWRSIDNLKAVSLIFHYMDDSYKIYSNLIASKCFKLGDSIESCIITLLSKWKLKFSVITCDAEIRNDSGIEELSIRCFIGTINSLVNNSLCWVQLTYNNILKWYRLDTEIEWNDWYTTYNFLKNIVDKHNTVSTNHRSELIALLDILKIFKEVVDDMCYNDEVLSSKILYFTKAIREWIQARNNNLTPVDLKKIVNFLSTNTKAFNQYEGSLCLQYATLLDPRFKLIGCKLDTKYIKDSLHNLIVRVKTNTGEKLEDENTPPSILWKDFVNVTNVSTELDRYLQEPLLKRTANPLLWWKSRRETYPALHFYAIRYLCMKVTAVPCKQFFSDARKSLLRRRRMLDSKEIPEIVFLNYNM